VYAMASNQIVKAAKMVQPMISLDRAEARARVLSLYKAWYRQIPQIVDIDYHIQKTKPECRAKLKEQFMKHKDVQDIRVIDILVFKGQNDLKETVRVHKQNHGLMAYWRETAETTKPQDFMGKFLDGHN